MFRVVSSSGAQEWVGFSPVYALKDPVEKGKTFKNRASAPNAAPYQTQINAALRTFIEQKGGAGSNPASLLENEQFLDSLADRRRDRMAVTRKR